MRSTRMLFVLFCVVLFLGCNLENTRIEGHYYGTGNDMFYNGNVTVHSYIGNNVDGPITNDATFIDFFQNGTYVMYLHQFEYGDYYIDKNIVYFTSSDSLEWSLQFQKNPTDDNRVFTWLKDGDYVGSYMELKRKDNCRTCDSYPFNLENNQWRIKPDEPETTNQVIDRLQNHLKFMERYLAWSNDNRIQPKFHNLPSPLKVARNGFRVNNFSQQSSWCRYLHKDNCKESYDLLKKYFRSNKFEWKKTSNQNDKLVHGLGQIRVGLKAYRTE